MTDKTKENGGGYGYVGKDAPVADGSVARMAGKSTDGSPRPAIHNSQSQIAHDEEE
ncbi:hypothetical protein [uncultured Algimonas sp.]|uniref:hypothetical protein n=1 Tax=uncultured Algimonas sp. TaxID=1547920 RepID=UPI002610AB22|nr:hypothetical protein [uncultured Algimonas sp.]